MLTVARQPQKSSQLGPIRRFQKIGHRQSRTLPRVTVLRHQLNLLTDIKAFIAASNDRVITLPEGTAVAFSAG
jgi:hypothetical protein